MDLIDGNARNLAYNTVIILRQHDQDDMRAEKLILKAFGGELLDPLEIAITWARSNLGKGFRLRSRLGNRVKCNRARKI